MQVIGLDSSPGAVEVCRRRGVDAVVGRLGDAPGLPAGRFDADVMLGNNLGLLSSPAQAPECLHWLAELCVPGAKLIGEGLDPRHTERPDHLAQQERARAAGRPCGQVTLRVRFRTQIGEWFSYWHLTPDELSDVLERTPWALKSMSGARNYIAVLERR